MLLKEMHCKKKARVCNATDATDNESDDGGNMSRWQHPHDHKKDLEAL